jgi:hypothetical protein
VDESVTDDLRSGNADRTTKGYWNFGFH